ncbi:hypothetical protein Tco_0305059 [Tanacetum coccineum]
MADLKFADTHNLVAFLSKPAESEGFEQIFDFMNANPINYALTVNSTIYTSCIEQFWATVKAKTVNGEVQLQALVDGKKVIITESTVRRDLQLEDAEEKGEDSEIPTDPHHTPTIIESSSQPQKKDKPKKPKKKGTQGAKTSWRTQLLKLGLKMCLKHPMIYCSQKGNTLLSGEDSMQLKKLMDFCTKFQQRVLDPENTKTAQAHEITSLKLKVKKLERRNKSRTHGLKRLYRVGSSRRVESSKDEGLGEEGTSKQGRRIDDIDADEGVTLVDETVENQGKFNDEEMFDTGVLDDEEVFAGHDMAEKEINGAEKEVSVADPVPTAGEVVTTASVEVSIASPTEATISDELALAQTLIEIKSAKPKVKGVVIGEQSESTTTIISSQLPSKDKAEEEEEARLAREKAEKEQEANVALIEEWNDIRAKMRLIKKRRKYFAAKRAEEKRNKPPTKGQQRSIMGTYLKNMAGWKPKDLKNKSFANIQELFDNAIKRVNTFVDFRIELMEGTEMEKSSKKAEVMEESSKRAEIAQESSSKRAGDELEHENAKKQKVDDDQETSELQSLMEVILDEEKVAVDAIPLATKPPSIVDWKIIKEGKTGYF